MGDRRFEMEDRKLQMMTLRRASVDDVPLIRKIADVAFRLTYKDILSPEQMEYMMDWMYSETSLRNQFETGHVFFIAQEGEKAVGYVSVEYQGNVDDVEVFHLQKLYLLPEYQKKGYGRKMFGKVVEYVRSQTGSVARIELNVNRNNPSLSFYEHIGMKRLSQGDFPIGNGYFMNDYIMGFEVDRG